MKSLFGLANHYVPKVLAAHTHERTTLILPAHTFIAGIRSCSQLDRRNWEIRFFVGPRPAPANLSICSYVHSSSIDNKNLHKLTFTSNSFPQCEDIFTLKSLCKFYYLSYPLCKSAFTIFTLDFQGLQSTFLPGGLGKTHSQSIRCISKPLCSPLPVKIGPNIISYVLQKLVK